MHLLGIAYLGLDVPDVDAWTTFGTDVVGMMPARLRPAGTPEDVVLLKADERQWRVALHPAERGGLRYAGFELGSRAAFELAVAHLGAEGAAFEHGTAEDCAARGVRDLVALVDPSGVRVELTWGPVFDGGFVSPVGVPRFVAGELGFGHYVVLTPDLDASLDVYTRVLGFRRSDHVVIGTGRSVQFLRCTARHHSVALTHVGPVSALHHVAFEVGDIDQVGYALDRAVRAGHTITASLGRHKNDRMLSFYLRSPAGFEVEIGCGGRLVDDLTWVENEVAGGDEWGHHGLSGASLEGAAGR